MADNDSYNWGDKQMNSLWRLGIDLGSNSLGWAALALDETGNPSHLIDMGVRIFSDARDPQSKESNAATRRAPRGARRNRDRYLMRRAGYLKLLQKYGLMPLEMAECAALENLDPWVLRARGVAEPLTLHELGRALFHLQQRRGFQSNRLTDKGSDEKGKVNKGAAAAYDAMAHYQTETLGELKGKPRLDRLSLPEGQRGPMPLARVRSSGEGTKLAYDYYPLRAMIADEFDVLWQTQAHHHNELTAEAREALRGALLFQRPLKPQPVGRCTLENAEERAPNALPSSQRLRTYQELNNLRFTPRPGEPRQPLTLKQRDAVFAKLDTTAKLGFGQIRKILGLPDSASFNLEEGKREHLDGNKTIDQITGGAKNKGGWKAFGDLAESEQDALVEIFLGRAPPIGKSTAAVHHTHGLVIARVAAALSLDLGDARELLEAKDDMPIIDLLCERYNLDETTAERIIHASLPTSHGRLSRTAGDKVLPMLITPDADGNLRTFDKAVVEAGYRSHSLLGDGEIFDGPKGLPYYGAVLERSVAFGSGVAGEPDENRIGKVANPTVHVALNQLRHVYNALAKRFGPPAQIVLELARDLPLSARGKAELSKKQNDNRKANEQRAKELRSWSPPQRDNYQNRLRLRLWDELDALGKKCAYSGKQIARNILFSDQIEIDHILPFARTLDDGIGNKILVYREANRRKGNRSPWEAMEAGVFDRTTIEAAIRDLPEHKAWRFGPDAMERYENKERDFLARQLTDTRHMAVLAKRFMDATGADCWVVAGRLTSDLRHFWALNSMLSSHNSAPPDTESDAVKKNRNDHRHHAIDAFVIACTDRRMVKAAADNAKTVEDYRAANPTASKRLFEDVPEPFPGYLEQVKAAAAKLIVSHKPDHGVQGELHEGTNYGVVRSQDGGQRLATRKAITGLTANEIKNIGDDRIRRELIALTDGFGDKERLAALLQYTLDTGHKRVRVHKKQEAFESIRHGPDGKGKSHYRAVIPGENHCMDIVEDTDGKWRGIGITRFEAHQAGWQNKWRNTFPAGRLVMRLHRGDLIKLLHDGIEKVMLVHDLRPSANLCKLAPHNETGKLQERHDDKNDPFRWDFGSISGYKDRRARLVHVTPDGHMFDPGPPS